MYMKAKVKRELVILFIIYVFIYTSIYVYVRIIIKEKTGHYFKKETEGMGGVLRIKHGRNWRK